MSVYQTTSSWLRQTLAWSNTWASWNERIVLALFAIAGIGLAVLSAHVPWWLAGILWIIYFVAMTVGTRQGWLKLVGPVLFYDMVRTARQSRYIVMRLLYSGLLLLILWVFFATSSARNQNDRDVAILAQQFFSIFMVTQLSMVVLLTPAYVAGAIAEEKDRKTLEFMLATDLSNHEIVLSKLLSRMANMTMFLLTGLPILSILQFVGGVDTELMLYGFLGTGLTMLGIASISILYSTSFQKPRDAIGLTYLTIVAYAGLGTLGKSLVEGSFFLMREPLWNAAGAPTYGDLSGVINAGNPIAAIVDVGKAINAASLATDLPAILTRYAWFHGVLTLVCVGWSIARLRIIALKQTVGGKTTKLSWLESERPAIGELPMLWKELYIDSRIKLNWLAWGIVVLLVLLTIGTGVMVIGIYAWDEWFQFRGRADPLSRSVNVWFRIAGTGVACLMLLIVGVRGSTAISNERERDTLDALLTTPLSCEAILAAKLLGVLTSVRLGWLWFGSMIALALFTGGLHLLAVPIVIGSWFVYALFMAMLGLWFSMACRSSLRATVLTVLTALFVGGGHWVLMGLCCYIPSFTLLRGGGDIDLLQYLAKFELGMTPPFVIGLCSYSWHDLAHEFHRDFEVQMFYFSLIGIFLWGMACIFLWHGLLLPKFREITRREELRYQ